MKANFVPVKGYEEYYLVNELGEVMSSYTGFTLKHGEAAGYPKVTLYRPGKRPKTYHIHRLIAEHFIPNPNGLPQVNHKNGNKYDFSSSNLEWCSASQNLLHAIHKLKRGNGWGTTRSLVDRSKVCEHCKETFKYKKKQQKFCGNSCAAKEWQAIELFKQKILEK